MELGRDVEKPARSLICTTPRPIYKVFFGEVFSVAEGNIPCPSIESHSDEVRPDAFRFKEVCPGEVCPAEVRFNS